MHLTTWMFRAAARVALAAVLVLSGLATTTFADEPPGQSSSQLGLGPNVFVFDPTMSTSQIQTTVDKVLAQQVDNEFGTQRYAFLFKPGVYGSATAPLHIQVGYYTSVLGLGVSPDDVTINGTINVLNRCLGPGNCIVQPFRLVLQLLLLRRPRRFMMRDRLLGCAELTLANFQSAQHVQQHVRGVAQRPDGDERAEHGDDVEHLARLPDHEAQAVARHQHLRGDYDDQRD